MKEFYYNKLKDFKWDSETLGYVAQIHEFKGRQEQFMKQKPIQVSRLLKIAKIQSTEASNKIEGIVTTSSRIKQLCADKTTPKNRDEKEIMGYRDVLATIHDSYEFIPIKTTHILQLHRDLYKYSEKSIGGRYKNTQNYISETRIDGSEFIRFTPLAPYETPEAIGKICDSFSSAIDSCNIDPLVLIPIFINDFLCIHPFNDGNGRISRLITALLLYRSGYMVGKYISLESKIEETKEEYYDALEKSGRGWHEDNSDSTPFVKYLLAIILSAYRDFESRVEITEQKNTVIDIVRKAVVEKLGKFNKAEIMHLCPTISKASVENSLKALTQDGTIKRQGAGRSTFYVKVK